MYVVQNDYFSIKTGNKLTPEGHFFHLSFQKIEFHRVSNILFITKPFPDDIYDICTMIYVYF